MIDVPLPPFAGFGPTATDWFVRLDADNSKKFFLATKTQWDCAIRAPMEELIAETAEQFGGTTKLFRPYRDVRFSPDKRPIKTSVSGYVTRPGTLGFLYAELSAAGLYAGTGLYDPARDQLTRLRAAIDDDRRGGELETIVAALARVQIEVGGESLATAPKGYPRDHPRIALLRMKYIVAGARLAPGPGLHDRRALDHAFTVWRKAEPLVAWLDAHVGPSEIAAEERFARR